MAELIALDDAEIKYSTVQNWYAGDERQGGIYNFVTKRGSARVEENFLDAGRNRSAITWKYPSCILMGDNWIGEFYSVALTNHAGSRHRDQDDPSGKNTRSTIISKGDLSRPCEQQLSRFGEGDAKLKTLATTRKCDSMLIGSDCSANTFPISKS